MNAATDELTKPLRRAANRPRQKIRFPVAQISGGLIAALAAIFTGTIALIDDPLGGEPHALVPIETRPAPSVAQAGEPQPESPGDPRQRSAAEVERASGVAIVRGDGAAAPQSVVIRVDDPSARPTAGPDRRLLERNRHGALPRVGADGARPAEVYARPAGALPGGARPEGRIALLVGGLGISQSATADAIAKLPPAITLGFAPYGGQLEQHAARAREDGHEIMLQVPMEPFDYPDNDPGPHTLTAGARTTENLDRLRWVMSRISGYVGLVNFMGAKLTGDEAALVPILREVGGRGLLFLDDGTSSRSLLASVGQQVQAPAARADAVIDAVPRADAIDRELGKIEDLARKRGLVVATATALPLTTERIARWARTLEERNILLVPVSSAFGAPKR